MIGCEVVAVYRYVMWLQSTLAVLFVLNGMTMCRRKGMRITAYLMIDSYRYHDHVSGLAASVMDEPFATDLLLIQSQIHASSST
jgi:hypothetical protein